MQPWLGREPVSDRMRRGLPAPAAGTAGLAVQEPGRTGAIAGCQDTRSERSLRVCVGVVSVPGPAPGENKGNRAGVRRWQKAMMSNGSNR